MLRFVTQRAHAGHAVCFAFAVALPASADAAPTFTTGFEPPVYAVGDVSGQDGWMTTPMHADGLIQSGVVASGTQALQLVDAASFGRAQHSVTAELDPPTLTASFALRIPADWTDLPDTPTDPFEAQERVELTSPDGPIGLGFGLIHAPVEFDGLAAGTTAYYIELGNETATVATDYQPVSLASLIDTWHTYRLDLDLNGQIATLLVDGTEQAQIPVTLSLSDISNIQLQNIRAGTSPNNNRSVYFDDVSVTIPEPAAAVLVGLAGPMMLRRRRPG